MPAGHIEHLSHAPPIALQLLAKRGKLHRIARHRTLKVLAGWNGLAISGLVVTWRGASHAPALDLALRVGWFMRDTLVDGECHQRAAA
jgi:uncharacterized protein YyaL (SSP411 family)